MFRFFQRFFPCLASLAFVAFAQAAPFVAPAEENPPFRRDLLPIDTDSMSRLSDDLTILTQGYELKTAADRRAAAQSLALALALDPANSGARDTISKLGEEKEIKRAKSGQLTEATSRIWQIHAWLTLPEAGADGNLLGDMMGDVASVLDPKNPVGIKLQESPEKGLWGDLVAPLSAFEENEIAVVEDTDPFEDVEPDVMEEPVVEKEPASTVSIILEKGSLTSVLDVYDKATDSWELRPVEVGMVATADGGGAFNIVVTGLGAEQQAISKQISTPIGEALKKIHKELPVDGLITIATSGLEPYSYAQNRTRIRAPGFILANSAITGVETEATVLVAFNEMDSLAVPQFFWRQIKALEKGNGGRLIIPAGTEEYFSAMLAMEQPEFFLKYEVLIASSPEEFLEFCEKFPTRKEHASALANFREIKSKAESGSLATYLGNRFVRQRLEEIIDAAPYHLSARMLAKQGAGERPRVLTRKVLASEIWRVIAPVTELSKLRLELVEPPATIAKIEDAYETMRAALDPLDRYTDINDRELLSEGLNVASTVRTLGRTLRIRSNDGVVERYNAILAAQAAMVSANSSMVAKLSEITGDPYSKK